jgi:hypothetical protein
VCVCVCMYVCMYKATLGNLAFHLRVLRESGGCLSIYLSICLSVCLSVCLCIICVVIQTFTLTLRQIKYAQVDTHTCRVRIKFKYTWPARKNQCVNTHSHTSTGTHMVLQFAGRNLMIDAQQSRNSLRNCCRVHCMARTRLRPLAGAPFTWTDRIVTVAVMRMTT